MDHPVFGKIERTGPEEWYGQIRLPFFSDYIVASDDEQSLAYQHGDFDLILTSPSEGQPSAAQEREFIHFLQNRDTICRRVVHAIFDYYQSNWGDWRCAVGDDSLIPELQSPDHLKQLICLTHLHVHDRPPDEGALLGFGFGCSWDPEHGLNVFVRRGYVIGLGDHYAESDLPLLSGPFLTDQIEEQKAIARIKPLGGAVSSVAIDLHDKPVKDDDLTPLRYCHNLYKLELAGTRITDALLTGLGKLTKLESLALSRTAVTDAGLVGLRGLSNLKNLQLSGTAITDAGLKELGARHALVVLYLAKTKVTDAGIRELRRVPHLHHLELSGTAVTDAGLQELKVHRGLVSLALEDTPVTNAGLKVVKGFESLRYLNLSGSKVTDAGLKELRSLQCLRSLQLQRTAITSAGIAELRLALPKLQVIQ